MVCVGARIVMTLNCGDTRAMLQILRAPFVFSLLDVAGALGRLRHPHRRESHASRGKFNCGHKVQAWPVSGSLSLVFGTGFPSWRMGGLAGPHLAAAMATPVLLGAPVVIGDVNPSTRPVLRGVVLQWVRRFSAAKHRGGRIG